MDSGTHQPEGFSVAWMGRSRMGPVGHLGITLGGAQLLNAAPRLKLDLWVVAFSSLVPDLVDKPLYLAGVGDGRYVGHTLLFAFLFAGAFSVVRKAYGLSALVGVVAHLFLDYDGYVPWLYPLVSRDFSVSLDLAGMPARCSTFVAAGRATYQGPFALNMELVGMMILLGLLCYHSWRHLRALRHS